MFANIGELLASSSLPKPLVAELPAACFGDKQPSAKWTAGWTAELLVAELPGERVVAEGRLGMRLSMPRARAVEEYSNSSKVKWGVNCIRKRIYDE